MTYTRAQYRQPGTLAILMDHAATVAAGDKAPAMVRIGNTKIGTSGRKAHKILVSKGLSFHDCPNMTAVCGSCYDQKFRSLHAASNMTGSSWWYSYLIRYDLPRWEAQIRAEIAREVTLLPPGSLVVKRWHEGGDVQSREHAQAMLAIMEDFPRVQFFGYSRSFGTPGIASVLSACNTLPNCVIRRSFDSYEAMVADGRRYPAAFIDGKKNLKGRQLKHAVPYHRGVAVCPEQTHGIHCADCGICWQSPRVPVQFLMH